jgi:hypothetical protein
VVRLDGPVQAVGRTATRDHVINHIAIHAGEPVLVVLATACPSSVVADTIMRTIELGATITDAAIDDDATTIFCTSTHSELRRARLICWGMWLKSSEFCHCGQACRRAAGTGHISSPLRPSKTAAQGRFSTENRTTGQDPIRSRAVPWGELARSRH